MAFLELRDFSFTYPEAPAPAVRGVSLAVERGEIIAVCGATGSGKSTLLRCLKRELAPVGTRRGEILLDGVPVDRDAVPDAKGERASAAAVGFVAQRPEEQIVTDRVWHELAFGLESIGAESGLIRRRVAETASYFGIADLFDRPTDSLSGGQKQLLNLAAVMTAAPELLILDEPTAQLDPIAASDFLAAVSRLSRDLGLTVVIAEHRLEEVVPMCSRLLVMEEGRAVSCLPPREAAAEAVRAQSRLLPSMPAAARVFAMLPPVLRVDSPCPLSVSEGRALAGRFANTTRSLPAPKSGSGDAENAINKKDAPARRGKSAEEYALEFSDVHMRYARDGADVLRGLDLRVRRGEIVFLLGGNGSGKTSALRCAAGLRRFHAGSIRVFGKKIADYANGSLYNECLAMLPQDVQTLFLKPTVREELELCRKQYEKTGGESFDSALPLRLAHLADRHPYDLSGGEQQLLGLAKALAAKPRLLLLDEPTKGLDAEAKRRFASLLRELQKRGTTIVAVTHDVELAAACADRCAMMFRGEVVSEGEPREFFGENSFYTTAVSRMTRGIYDGAVTAEDAAELMKLNGLK